MQDNLSRNIDYIRISLTDRCNLRCLYCMPEKGVDWVPHHAILNYEELLRLSRIFAELGIHKIKLTGGEPLLRKGLPSLIRDMKSIDGIENITLTTNGVILKDMIGDLAEAGLDAVTISLDSLDRETFIKLTRRDELDNVLAGIYESLKYPSLNVKVNTVPTDYNKDQLVAIAALAKDNPISVRYIEMMPIGLGKDLEYFSEEAVKQLLEAEYGQMTPYSGKALGNGPSHYYEVPAFKGKIGFISAISHQFCSQCNRVRLTAEGFLKTCLQYETGTDLRSLMRKGSDDETLRQAVQMAVYQKPSGHRFTDKSSDMNKEQKIMSRIGG